MNILPFSLWLWDFWVFPLAVVSLFDFCLSVPQVFIPKSRQWRRPCVERTSQSDSRGEVRIRCDVVRSVNRTQVSVFDVLYRHKKRSVLEMSQSDEWAACIRQSDWGFFLLGSTLDPLWRGTCFITVKKQMETAMNVLVINPDRSARTYNRIFLVQRLLITCHLFNVIENKWMYIHFTCQKNSFLRIICVLVKSNQWFRGISKINYLLTTDSFYNVTMLLEHFPIKLTCECAMR